MEFKRKEKQFCLQHVQKSTCMECQEKDCLWYCLTCGHIGCSRHKQGHALAHYRKTKHPIAMDLANYLAWNYDRELYATIPKAEHLQSMFVTTNEDCKCPVCRYQQLPKLFRCTTTTTTTTCMSCEDTTNLWLCLSCSHIGCGRHEQAHALLHYQDSEHSHVMHLINFSIWNYKEHKYVHRLYSETPNVPEKTSPEINIKKEPSRQGDKEEDGGHFEKRIKLLENEWKNFSKLKETNRQMISIEQRLISLSEEKKLLEGKVREHDTKLNELLNQFKDGNQNELLTASSNSADKTDLSTLPSCSRNASDIRSLSNNLIISLSDSDQTQLIIFFIILLLVYTIVQAITGKN